MPKQVGNPNFLEYNDFLQNIEELDMCTRYRFAEIELNYAIKQLGKFYPYQMNTRTKALDLVLNVLMPHATEQENAAFHDLLIEYRFNHPTKEELIYYFRYNKVSYGNIRHLTGISPNTIAKAKDKPYYLPLFPHWTVEHLERWNNLKPAINIFGQELHHTNVL